MVPRMVSTAHSSDESSDHSRQKDKDEDYSSFISDVVVVGAGPAGLVLV